MSGPRVHFLTCENLPEPDLDEATIVRALQRRGIDVGVVPWERVSEVDSDAVYVIRSTWNYYEAPAAFLDTLARIQNRAKLYNSCEVARWNIDKAYLRELDTAGIATTPTQFVNAGGSMNFAKLARDFRAQRLVVKPSISAGSNRTYMGSPSELSALPIAADRTWMVQPYMQTVESTGERSHIVIDGEPLLAVRKSRRFAGEEEETRAVSRSATEEAFVGRVIAEVERRFGRLLYARVDILEDELHILRVMELELLEPSLFFRYSAEVTEAFCDSLMRRILGPA